jgi:hypothetical protein
MRDKIHVTIAQSYVIGRLETSKVGERLDTKVGTTHKK